MDGVRVMVSRGQRVRACLSRGLTEYSSPSGDDDDDDDDDDNDGGLAE
jgi:hypothetical protein